MSDILLNLPRRDLLRLHEQLEVLALPPSLRKLMLRRMQVYVLKLARKNVHGQHTISGHPMEPRKLRRQRRLKRKMLRTLARTLAIVDSSDTRFEASWKSPVAAKIAARHQLGGEEQSGTIKARREKSYVKRKAACPRYLARELVEAGFRREVRTKGRVSYPRTTVKWVMANMTRGRATALLHVVRGTSPEKTWIITNPPRPFLGVDPANADAMLTDLARQALAEVKRIAK